RASPCELRQTNLAAAGTSKLGQADTQGHRPGCDLGADRPTPGRSTSQAHIDRLGAVLNGLRFTTSTSGECRYRVQAERKMPNTSGSVRECCAQLPWDVPMGRCFCS